MAAMAAQDLVNRFQRLRTTESDTQSKVEVKTQQELGKAKKLLATLDQETSELLEEYCCTIKQTAQFMNYISSTPCISICETEDIPPYKWGGWYQSRFMMLYIRTLKETIVRMKLEQDNLLEKDMLRVLENELDIAVGTYRSANDREHLETAKRDLDLKKTEMKSLQESEETAQNKAMLLIAQIQQIEVELEKLRQKYAHTENEYDVARSTYLKYLNPEQTSNLSYNGSNRGSLFRNSSQDSMLQTGAKGFYFTKASNLSRTMDQISEEYASLNQKRSALELQYAKQQALTNSIKLQCIKVEREHGIAEAHFSKLLHEKENNLFNCVTRLYIGQHHCHAVGFKGHAIYADFENIGSHICVKIGNLGLGADQYHYTPYGRNDLILPYVFNFPNTEIGRTHLLQFCKNITLALTKDKDEALKLIYAKLDEALSKEQHGELHHTFAISAELPQSTGNCTAKGYLHLLRERMLKVRPFNQDDHHKRYRRLMMSLFVWSKHAYLLRQTLKNDNLKVLPLTMEDFFTQADVDALRNSEQVFEGFAHIKQYLITMKENILGLALRPEELSESNPENTRLANINLFRQDSRQDSPQQYFPRYRGMAAPLPRASVSQNGSEPESLTTTYSARTARRPSIEFSLSDSTVNTPQYSETTLRNILFKQPDISESPKRRKQRNFWE